MVTNVLRDLWAEPAPDSPRRSPLHQARLDVAAVVILIGLGLADGLLSDNIGWPALSIPLMTAIPVALYWRRAHTLTVTIVVSGAYFLLHTAMLIAGVSSTMLNVGVIAVLIYTLARWASGQDALVGLGVVSIATAVGASTGLARDLSGAVGLPIFLSLFLLAGVAVRLWSGRGAARISEAKMAERNRIARELHDTIAHHVSAIAVQAQGGQEVLRTDPEAAGQALAVIEEQASLTLAEMRVILGVLRDRDSGDRQPAERSPTAGLEDIVRLADSADAMPNVGVTMSGDLENISASVGSALYRLAQEAITNTRRHAPEATSVAVDIVGSDDHVQLTVTDNGPPTTQSGPGYGLLGMSERAALLGGHCSAGPAPSGGWAVTASLPREGRAS